LELLVEGQWVSVMAEAVASEPLDEAVPFQIIDFELPDAIVASGARLTGSAGGTHGFVTIAEIDVFGTPCSERVDLDGDLDADVFDLLAYLGMWFAAEPGAERTGQEPSVIDVFDLLAYLDAWFAG